MKRHSGQNNHVAMQISIAPLMQGFSQDLNKMVAICILCMANLVLAIDYKIELDVSDSYSWKTINTDQSLDKYKVKRLDDRLSYFDYRIPEFASSNDFGKIYKIKRSLFVKRFVINCPGAGFMRVDISSLVLPENVKLIFRSSSGEDVYYPIEKGSLQWDFNSRELFFQDSICIIDLISKKSSLLQQTSFTISNISIKLRKVSGDRSCISDHYCHNMITKQIRQTESDVTVVIGSHNQVQSDEFQLFQNETCLTLLAADFAPVTSLARSKRRERRRGKRQAPRQARRG